MYKGHEMDPSIGLSTRVVTSWNGTEPFCPGLIPVFVFAVEWNPVVTRIGIFCADAEPTRPAKSAGPSETGAKQKN